MAEKDPPNPLNIHAWYPHQQRPCISLGPLRSGDAQKLAKQLAMCWPTLVWGIDQPDAGFRGVHPYVYLIGNQFGTDRPLYITQSLAPLPNTTPEG